VRLLVLLLLACCAIAADRVVLRNGGELLGNVVAEDDAHVVLESGGTRLVLPRATVERIEHGVDAPVPEHPETLRDEWFAIEGETVLGWRHVVQTRTSTRGMIQVRDVFAPPGRSAREVRRVEETTASGEPVSSLLVETGPGAERILSARRVAKGIEVRTRTADGDPVTETLPAEGSWTFPLTAVSRFVREAAPGAEAERTAYEPFAGLVTLRLERLGDRPGADPPVHVFRVRERGAAARTIVTDAGGGMLAVEGEQTLRRVSAEHAELIRRALVPERTLELDKALMHPFQRRLIEKPDLARYQLRAGMALELPSEGWKTTAHPRRDGLVWTFENDDLLASVEVFIFPLPGSGADADACLADARARLGRVVDRVESEAPSVARTVSGLDARVESFAAFHRAEHVAGLLAAVRADNRMVMLVAGSPPDAASLMRVACEHFLDSLVIAPLPPG